MTKMETVTKSPASQRVTAPFKPSLNVDPYKKFYLMRREFPNRQMTLAELAMLINMLGQWYPLKAEHHAAAGRFEIACRLYACTSHQMDVARDIIRAKIPAAICQQTDDDLLISVPESGITTITDPFVWRCALQAAHQVTACIELRLTIRGKLGRSPQGNESTTTFVICGEPQPDAIITKAIWQIGRDCSFEEVYRLSPWMHESAFLKAFSHYVALASKNPNGAAKSSWDEFRRSCKHVFVSDSDEHKTMRLTRVIAELPADRGVTTFLKRLSPPLAIGVVLAVLPLILDFHANRTLVLLVAVFNLLFAGKIVFDKARLIYRYRTHMRRGLNSLYSSEITYEITDLSQDPDRSIRQYSAEIADMAAKHICDFAYTTSSRKFDAHRFYVSGATTIILAFLRRTDNHYFFPAKPILHLFTRLADGSTFITTNVPLYRRRVLPNVFTRCVLHTQRIGDLLAIHEQRVRVKTAMNIEPTAPPATPEEVIAHLQREHERSKAVWKKSPYSWSDAVYESFKICRREYLQD